MKNFILVILFSLILISVFSGNIMALNQEKQLNMLIDISPYITLELGKNIDIDLKKPWQGGEVQETTSQLSLQTNTKVELSWETTKLTNKKTGRSLPLGIPTQVIQKLIRGEKVETSDQPFGLNTFLINAANLQTYNTNGKNRNENVPILTSVVKDKEILQSSHGYILNPGIYDFDIIVQYYWAKEGVWSRIIAGEYTGEILYTIAAVEDMTE